MVKVNTLFILISFVTYCHGQEDWELEGNSNKYLQEGESQLYNAQELNTRNLVRKNELLDLEPKESNLWYEQRNPVQKRTLEDNPANNEVENDTSNGSGNHKRSIFFSKGSLGNRCRNRNCRTLFSKPMSFITTGRCYFRKRICFPSRYYPYGYYPKPNKSRRPSWRRKRPPTKSYRPVTKIPFSEYMKPDLVPVNPKPVQKVSNTKTAAQRPNTIILTPEEIKKTTSQKYYPKPEVSPQRPTRPPSKSSRPLPKKPFPEYIKPDLVPVNPKPIQKVSNTKTAAKRPKTIILTPKENKKKTSPKYYPNPNVSPQRPTTPPPKSLRPITKQPFPNYKKPDPVRITPKPPQKVSTPKTTTQIPKKMLPKPTKNTNTILTQRPVLPNTTTITTPKPKKNPKAKPKSGRKQAFTWKMF